MSKENEIELMSYTENNQKWLQCKSCYEYKKVDDDTQAITCSKCTMIKALKLKPMDEFFAKQHKKTGRPAGWHFMSEFVDKDGNVFCKGKEQPKLKGTLKPTKVKARKKKKKLTADEKLFKRAADWKKRLKAKRGSK
mgnify:CR=1 FL=1|tara:strand:+ start:76 stop:486 length:411 start_codon:yes stop_codon:yes gene_type:complete